MTQTATPFFMFEGKAEEALNLYVATFANSQIDNLERYGPEGPGKEGSVYQGHATIAGLPIRVFDSPAPHGFGFTPSISMFVDFDDAGEMEAVFNTLCDGGRVMMPLGDYPFSPKFGWVQDRFGISWQLNLKG